ncbi:MAG TPA: HAD family hydrolase [Thermodesulfobacteriota bacterium]|nr:HAD family hydrolase [Thermodesulfobacteriota bacterium]
MKGNQNVNGVIFDLDGTLIDSYRAIYLAFKDVYENLGLPPLLYEVTRKVVGRGLNQTFQELLGENQVPRALTLFRKKYKEVFRTHTHLLPDVREVLETLHGRDVQMAVATNKFGCFSRAIFKHLGMEKYFAVIVGDGDVSENKPNPEMIYYALGKMGVEKDDTVFVGDSVIDIQTAKNAGLRVFAVPTGNTAREDLEKALPTVILDRLLDLLTYI